MPICEFNYLTVTMFELNIILPFKMAKPLIIWNETCNQTALEGTLFGEILFADLPEGVIWNSNWSHLQLNVTPVAPLHGTHVTAFHIPNKGEQKVTIAYT